MARVHSVSCPQIVRARYMTQEDRLMIALQTPFQTESRRQTRSRGQQDAENTVSVKSSDVTLLLKCPPRLPAAPGESPKTNSGYRS